MVFGVIITYTNTVYLIGKIKNSNVFLDHFISSKPKPVVAVKSLTSKKHQEVS